MMARRRIPAPDVGFDALTIRDSFRGPGMDTRQWVSWGYVETNDPDDQIVIFDEEYGQPHVRVKLTPSGIPVTCLVSSDCAGDGEGAWHPFVKGDTVIVAIPEGSEDAGCVIIGRVNRAKAAFPRTVAGQDATANTFGFRRQRTAFVHEVSGPWLVRNASTGAFFGIDKTGQLNFGSGSGAGYFMREDFVGIQNPDADVLMQIDIGKKRIVLEASGTKFFIDGSSSMFSTSGTLSFQSSGFPAVYHVASVESVIVLLLGVLQSLPGPGPYSPAQVATAITAGIPLAAEAPVTPFIALITAAFAAKLPDPTGQLPSIGSPGVLTG